MHQALQIPEILSLILGSLHTRPKSNSIRALAAAARTCRAFSEPALDILWEEQSTIMHVLDCIPGQVFLRSGFDEGGRNFEVTLTRELLPEDWERPLFYARRVKEFTLFDWDTCPVEALETLLLCFPQPCVFPNLRTMGWRSSEPETLPYVRLFLGPRLRTLRLGLCQSMGHLSLLPIIAAQCPLLSDLHINFCDELVSMRHGTSSLVARLHRLSTLMVPNLDRVSLEHLGQLPAFNSLTLFAQGPLPASSRSTPSMEPLFTALEYLEISVTDETAVGDVLALLASAPIVDLTISFPELTRGRAIAECYASIAKHCSHETLTTICMGETFPPPVYPNAEQIARHVVHGAQLLPLFSFKKLKQIGLGAPVGFDVDDATAAQMARSWPAATSISFTSTDFVHIPSRATLAGLLPFAEHCPRLTALILALDASVVPKQNPSHRVDRRLVHKKLTTLGVESAPINKPLDVAGFLSSAFPNLRTILNELEDKTLAADDPAQVAAGARRARWQEVARVLPLLRKVRAEEKYWQKRQSA
ncbi:hypothetical protein C8R46DRAFT_1088249 [Mycena filopes]|nr:hypothetical protein C8R46DRAFT_1088249 [Mycena filopes]